MLRYISSCTCKMYSELVNNFLLQIHEFSDICWDRCVDKPSSKLDGKTETCLTNCVDRFIDVSLLITNRFAQLLQKSGGLQD